MPKKDKRQKTVPVGPPEFTKSGTTAPVQQGPAEKRPLIQGRTFRAYVGIAIIVVDLAIFFVDHVLQDQAYELLEIGGHALFIGVGLLLIDPKLFTQFKDAVGSKLSKK